MARIYATQAAATARGAAVDTETAYVGTVSDMVDIGWWLTATGAGAGAVAQAAPALSETVRRRRAAARLVHAALQGWTEALRAEGVVHAAATVAVGHDYLYHAHQACYLMAIRDTLPVAQYESWCRAMAMGAADVTSPAAFFRVMEAGQGLAAPTQPCAWVRWGHTSGEGYTTAVRVDLADAIAESGPITVQAPGRLALDAADLPSDGLPADGSWIDRLAA